MPIAFTANSLQHWPSPSKRRPVCHRSATVRQVCRTGLTAVERVTDFSIFDLRGLPLGRRSPKGEMTWRTPISTILQNFIALGQHAPEISVTKVYCGHKNKQKNKYASCPDWRISPNADRRHHSCKRYFWQCIFKYKIQNTLYLSLIHI